MKLSRRRRAVSAAVVTALSAPLSCTSAASHPPPAPAPSGSSAASTPSPPLRSSARDASPTDAAHTDAAPGLPADVVARTAAAHARFGASARTRVVGGLFVLAEVGPPAAFLGQAEALLSRALPRLQAHFRTPPSEGVAVYLFSRASDYDAFSREEYGAPGSATFGGFRRAFRDIAVNGAGGADYVPTLTHEATHPLVQADFPGAPVWFEEGLASLFEAPIFDANGEVHGVARSRRQGRLSQALASATQREGVTLPALFAMSTRDFEAIPDGGFRTTDPGKQKLHYAMARSLCAWLDSRRELWPFYAAWRDGVADDPTGVKAFAAVTGGTPGAMSEKWEAWAR